ncbi:glycosyltransferase [Priestia flexa]|uniref:glycosyltransferase n=1 Tax=Priestia flexa TaxID=86664 RepID=UPI0011A4E796|nr:glycosyltransferase [Priestia flexa]MCG7314005.1 multidrug MFS transporter [Priestia flexa]UZW68061.1 multidrug MFS transporter [Priestia flexa]
MIFVTVGTHEQSFNRLLEEIDLYAKERNISKQDIVVQTGYSDYQLKYVTGEKMLSAADMQAYYEKADLILTHGGPGSMFPAWILGKPIIAIPRQVQFNEHVDNHQVEFCKFAERKGKVRCVTDIKQLSREIDDVLSSFHSENHKSKTNEFIQVFQKEIETLVK